MRVADEDLVGGTGVAIVRKIVNRDLGWLFREQLHSDVGIDAHVEPVAGGQASGQLIAVQIKTGASYLKERTKGGGIVFRPSDRHVRYWLSHALPVIVALVDPDTEKTYWQSITRDTLISTGKAWKVIVPADHDLTSGAASLEALSEADPYILELRQLQLARPWMQLLRDGGNLYLEVGEWIHKSSGRADIRLSGADQSSVSCRK